MLETRIEDWGLIDYQVALDRQLELVKEVQDHPDRQVIVLCSHSPVVTLGRKTKPEDVFGWQGETIEIQRGGRATYHGPNQLVIYPIVNLTASDRVGFSRRDLHGYLRSLEKCLLETVAEFGVVASPRPSDQFLEQFSDVEASGVWVEDRKLASIGIGVKKWVTYHGAAINLQYDKAAFSGMNPCGFTQKTPVSLEELVGESVDSIEFVKKLLLRIKICFSNS